MYLFKVLFYSYVLATVQPLILIAISIRETIGGYKKKIYQNRFTNAGVIAYHMRKEYRHFEKLLFLIRLKI